MPSTPVQYSSTASDQRQVSTGNKKKGSHTLIGALPHHVPYPTTKTLFYSSWSPLSPGRVQYMMDMMMVPVFVPSSSRSVQLLSSSRLAYKIVFAPSMVMAEIEEQTNTIEVKRRGWIVRISLYLFLGVVGVDAIVKTGFNDAFSNSTSLTWVPVHVYAESRESRVE